MTWISKLCGPRSLNRNQKDPNAIEMSSLSYRRPSQTPSSITPFLKRRASEPQDVGLVPPEFDSLNSRLSRSTHLQSLSSELLDSLTLFVHASDSQLQLFGTEIYHSFEEWSSYISQAFDLSPLQFPALSTFVTANPEQNEASTAPDLCVGEEYNAFLRWQAKQEALELKSRLLERFAIGLGSRTLLPSPRTLVMNLDLEAEGKLEVDGPEVLSLICKKGSPERGSSEAIESSPPTGENSSNDINKGKGRSPPLPLPFESPQQRLKELGWNRHDAWMRRKGSSGS